MNREERRKAARNKNGNSNNNNTNGHETTIKDNNMSTTATKTIAEIKVAALSAAKAKIANKTANKSAKGLLIKEISTKKNEINVARKDALEMVKGDELLTMELNQSYDLDIKKIDLEYKPQLAEFNIYKVEVTEQGAEQLIDFVTKPVAPLFRGLAAAGRRIKTNLVGEKK